MSRVIALDLSDTYGGEYWYLNASLFTPFQQLESLDLTDNKIASCVENEGIERLSRLNNLKMLNLSGNSFNNSILSSLTHLSPLRSLNLFWNRLEGSIDVKDSLRDLEELDIGGNKIDKFVVSKGLSKLKSLSLSGTRFKGTFNVREFNSFNNLELLDMSFNEINNLVVPQGYSGLRKLKSLDLSRVGVRDGSKLLQSMGSFPSLNNLYLSSNNFTETVTITTQGFPHFKSLEHLDMEFMRSALNTSFLQSIGESMSSLKYLSLSGSTIGINSSMILDQGLCSLVHLQELYIASNDLRGSLPWCLANMTSLRILDVSYNQLTGSISLSPC
ncbi:receptor-like protein 56 [Citrus sinensis]|nr:receptor-like protein 56 [Citrus sinensis]